MRAHRHVLRLPVLIPLICGALVLSACGEVLPATTLYPEGDHARRIYDLLVPVFWAAVAVFVVVEGLLVYAVVRFRRRAGDEAIPAQVHGNTRIEIAWTIAPALILLVIAVLTFRTQAQNSAQPPDALPIKVIGHQWWWEFQYPNQNFVTANDVYVPVGQPVQFQMTGADVIHDPWVPRLSGKTDAIPGHTNYVAFTAEREGIYRGLCAEFCGEQHAIMRFRVIAVQPAVFQQWVQQHQTPPGPPSGGDPARLGPGDPARGQQAFLKPTNLCITCHSVAGQQAAVGITGPNLTYFGNRETIAAGALENTPENLTRWLHDPDSIKHGTLMGKTIGQGPGKVALSDQDITDIVAYLESQTIPIAKPEAR
jgi:cytochrome c oxidase subunit II